MERRASKRPGEELTKLRGCCHRSPGPRPMEDDRAGLMRLQRRRNLSQVSQVDLICSILRGRLFSTLSALLRVC